MANEQHKLKKKYLSPKLLLKMLDFTVFSMRFVENYRQMVLYTIKYIVKKMLSLVVGHNVIRSRNCKTMALCCLW